jgi:tRNA(fMet)-specific endonuclease VapC
MSQYLLDTNHLSPLVTVVHPLREQIIAALANGDLFAIAAPVLNEFLFGIRTLPRAQQNVRIWEKIQADFIYYAVDVQDAEYSVDLRIDLMRRGRQLGVVDSFVAAVALRYDLTLLTMDKDFSAVPNLRQENWRAHS